MKYLSALGVALFCVGACQAQCRCVTSPGGVGTCGSYACPANGGNGPCPCSSTGEWLVDSDGSGDYGWYEKGVFRGRWFVKTQTYCVWDGQVYVNPGQHIGLIQRHPVAAAVASYIPFVGNYGFGGGGGGCSGGS